MALGLCFPERVGPRSHATPTLPLSTTVDHAHLHATPHGCAAQAEAEGKHRRSPRKICCAAACRGMLKAVGGGCPNFPEPKT